MVISKRCKICTTLDASNIPISGEYFGSRIPDLIAKVSGIELDSGKLNGVLLCQHCSIMLVHAAGVVDKLRKSVQRLAKTNKIAKTPRVTSKETREASAETPKKCTKTKPVKVNGDISFRKINDGTKSLHGVALITEKETPTKNAKRTLSYQQESEASESAKSDGVKKNSKRKSEVLEFSANTFLIDLDQTNCREKKRSNNSISLINEMDTKTDMYNASINEHSFKETKTKDLNCVLCGKKFNQKRTLREHIESSHMGEKLKECQNCFMEFRSVQKYESHVFSEKCNTALHPCQFHNCHRRFKNSHKMEEHMKEKHFSANILQ